MSRILRNTKAERRLNRAQRRAKLRVVLLATAIVFAVIGGLLALMPFGPSVSSQVVMLDTGAGRTILQMVDSSIERRIGLCLGLIGLILFICAQLVDNGNDDNQEF